MSFTHLTGTSIKAEKQLIVYPCDVIMSYEL